MATGFPPVKKYIDEEDSKFGPPSKPFKFDNIPVGNINLVFECEDCDEIQKETVSNCVYNGAPMCRECNIEMELLHAEVKI